MAPKRRLKRAGLVAASSAEAPRDEDDSDLKKRRQLYRRDTDGKAERIVERNFGHWTSFQRNQLQVDGHTLRWHIMEAVRGANDDGQVASDVLQQIAVRFLSNSPEFEALKVTSDEPVSETLKAALRSMVETNNKKRTTIPLLTYLKSCPSMSKRELGGLLRQALPLRPHCKTQQQVLFGILACIVRLELESTYPEMVPF